MKQLFLSHYRGDADEVGRLAAELRLRGIVPWVDRDGGLSVGDENEAEIWRAITDDCFGFLFYATRSAFERDFIRRVELPAALAKKRSDPSFVLFAVPRGLRFGTVQKLSRERFGDDLTKFSSRAIPRRADLPAQFSAVADDLIDLVMEREAKALKGSGMLQMQFSTREELPDDPADVLRISAVRQFAGGPSCVSEWARVLAGLRGVKRAVARCVGRPRVRVHGSKHLTAAFMLGRVFAPFSLETRQGAEYWCTAQSPAQAEPFEVTEQLADPAGQDLLLEISTISGGIAAPVERFARDAGIESASRLRFARAMGVDGTRIDAATGVAMASQVRRVGGELLGRRTIGRIHLFSAVPQAVAMMIGHELRGAPPVYFYEFDGTAYRLAAVVPGGSL